MASSSRFGGVNAAQAYRTKVYWIVGCLMAVILVLVVAVVFIATNSEAKKDETEAPPVPAETPVNNGAADVLIAQNRIESGEMLQEHMFTSRPMQESEVPMGAVRKKDLATLTGKFAARLINPNVPLVTDDVTDQRPINPLSIPPGYRAVTITVDSRSGVEGFAKPNTRVDVLWTFAQDGKQKVATICRFTKVLSVAGQTAAGEGQAAKVEGGTPVTLLVTEKDAKKIELARTLGTLSLSLVGDQEQGVKETEPDAITINDILGTPIATQQQDEVSTDGVMYTSDPRTGKQLRYILKHGRWTQDRNY